MSFSHTAQKSILDLLNEVEHSHDSASKQAADRYLQLALQTYDFRFEALLTSALRAFRASRWADACLDLARALKIFPNHEQTQALLGKAVSASDSCAALQLIDSFLNDFPESKVLWPLYWMCARDSGESKYAQEALERLPAVSFPTEFVKIIELLSSLDKAPQQLGVCQFDPETMTVTGWAIDRRYPQRACELRIESGAVSGRLIADGASELLGAAGLSKSAGGFQIKLVKPSEYLNLTFTDGTPLQGSPFAALAPLALIARTPREQVRFVSDERDCSPKDCVNVLIPVYGGRETTLRCLQSVLEAIPHNRVAHEIVVLDDASPDAELVHALSALAAQGKITLLRRPANLGFIRNMNRGMLLNQDRDVVWLNSDTLVAGNWLDRLQQSAYSDASVASVTPLSNNGELTSFPRMRESSPMPSATEHLELDQLMNKLDLPPEALFVGCGFCLYIKRSALEDVGLLDERALSRGYGEETEWCLRAHERGWRHAAAVNVFVAHSGGASFGRNKRSLVHRNNAVIKHRYPLASDDFDRFVQTDNLLTAREAIQRERLKQLASSGHRELLVYRNIEQSSLQRRTGILGFDPEKNKVDRDVLGKSSTGLTWIQTGIELDVQLIVFNTCPAIVLNYRLPQAADNLKRDLQRLSLSGYRVVDETVLPELLALSLKTLKKLNPLPRQERATLSKGSRPVHESKSLVTNEVALHAPELNTLGLIVDDLSDPVVAQQWVSYMTELSHHSAAHLPTGMMKLLALQDTPLVAQLEKTGLVVLANFPGGLSIERWLALFGVSHLVSCMKQETAVFTDAFEKFLTRLQERKTLERLPRVSARTWAMSLEIALQSRKSVRPAASQVVA